MLSEPMRSVSERLLLRAMIPQHFWRAKLSAIDEGNLFRESLRHILERLTAKVGVGINWIFYGGFSSGKTSGAVVLAKRAIRLGGTALFLPYSSIRPVFFEDPAPVLPPESTRDRILVRDRIRQVDLLILDDFGSLPFKPGSESAAAVETILRDRYNVGRSTILTTNLTLADLKNTMPKAVVSLLTRKGTRYVAVPVQNDQWG